MKLKNPKIITSAFFQAIGLRLHKQLKEDESLVFVLPEKSKQAIDMLFVFFPIDILWLDEKRKIIHLQKNAKPFCFYFSKKKAKYIVELRKGIINKNKLRLRQKLYF